MTYIDELHDEMMQSPRYREAHEASEPVYHLASALIGARASAKMTQEEVAERMQTTQSAVARLEGGRSNPSMRTLDRFAKATGTRLRISFEPIDADATANEEEADTSSGVVVEPASVGANIAEPIPVST